MKLHLKQLLDRFNARSASISSCCMAADSLPLSQTLCCQYPPAISCSTAVCLYWCCWWGCEVTKSSTGAMASSSSRSGCGTWQYWRVWLAPWWPGPAARSRGEEERYWSLWSRDAVGCRQEEEHSHHITALLLSVGLQSLLWVAEVLIAVNIDTGGLPWSAAFSPLYLLAVASVPACIWSCWRRRRVEVKGREGGGQEGRSNV